MKIKLKLACGFFSYIAMNTMAVAIDCTDESQLSAILKQAKISYSTSDLVDCKILPNQPNTQLIAYAEWRSEPHEPEVGDYILSLISWDQRQHKANDVYHVKEPLVSDAIALESIQLDTATYQLNSSLRAVGLRLNYRGYSQPNPFSMQLLDLYDLNNKRKILNSLIVNQYRAETDTRCNADIEERRSTLIMQKTQTNHFFDIELNGKIEKYEMYGTEKNCKKLKAQALQQKFILI
ncbi:hypothetical protein [Acinetobacter sp. Marseille-Q1618]|uniref:hypothetical protein n=1 Tax=Acinetobacter sp. Marseille-Q1618 TaxID=2697502 RepID=UPI0015703C71|nr:hypothetical protein [Acinetobacter sp. Marseille-Q1618]